jgi:hypothetical protein
MKKKIENMKASLLLSAFTFILVISAGSCKTSPEIISSRLSYEIGEVLIADDFSGSAALWSPEGAAAKIADGKMEIDASAFSAIWLRPALVGNVSIEYDVTLPAANEPGKTAGSFGCFAMASDPVNPKNFFAAGRERAGELSKYDNLNSYYFELGCDKKKSAKFLRYSGGKKEIFTKNTVSSYKASSDRKYHVKLLFFENTIEFYLNNRCLLSCEDSKTYTQGNFGFTAASNKVIIEQFKIIHLKKNN